MGHVELDFSAIPKLYGPENFWHWRMLLVAYLDANDLWSHDHPKDNAHAKFIILATVQSDKVEPGFDQETAKQVFQTLDDRFRPF